MAKVVALSNQDGSHGGWLVECPACGYGHLFDSRWTFNGNVDSPTFTPSMLVNASGKYGKVCHSFVTDGKIRFLNDCQHELAGQTVELKDI